MMTMYISPYRRIASLREAMDRAMEESMTEKTPSEREMLLAVDVRAANDEFIITAFVPGLDAESLNIEILNNTVSIHGEFALQADEDAKYITCELPSGRFGRVISLPTEIDSTKAQAAIKDGILTLRVPKVEAVRPRTIKINVN